MKDDFIERRILTGLIVSTEFIQQIRQGWNPELLKSGTAQQLAGWCLTYFDQYGTAPDKDIQGIYDSYRRKGLSDAKVEWIENLLSSLSDEYEHTTFNVKYLLNETKEYFQSQHLRNVSDTIKNELDSGNVINAEEIALGYSPVFGGEHTSIDPYSKEARLSIKEAFEEQEKPLFRFGKALGRFWGSEFTRDAFVALMGVRKIGKTFLLMEIVSRAAKAGCNVVLFQAGDMTQKQQLRRQGIYLTQRSDREKFCGKLYVPVVDCVFNQIDECEAEERVGEGIGISDQSRLKDMAYPQLVELYEEYPDHECCQDCKRFTGTPWFKIRSPVLKLDWKSAYKASRDFRKRYKPRIKWSSHPNESLSVTHIKSLLHIWERYDGFVPDVIVIDYADLLAPCPDIARIEFRHRTNLIWQRLRSLSQERQCLVVTATQAAATAFGKYLLDHNDFSEDRRKYDHVTAMFGMNQTEREKRIGIMRLNEMVVRDSDFYRTRQVHVLQRLEMGRPYLGSY